MNKKNVVVLFGGHSSEHEVSKVSGASIISNLTEEKYNIIPVYITQEGKWLLYDGGITNIRNVQWEKYGTPAILSPDRVNKGLLRIVGDKVKTIPVDIVFPALHGVNGEDGSVQGLLEMAGIPYVGCGVLASAVAMDKTATKAIAKTLGLQQAAYLSFTTEDLDDLDAVAKTIRYRIGYPCFVKPANTGSSIGISKARNKKELLAAIATATEYDRKILVEKGIVGRELECGILGDGGRSTKASVVGEIVPAADFYDYDAKYNNAESKTIVPADIPEDVAAQIQEQSLMIFKAIGGSGLSRVDFFWESDTGKVIFNEINTLPGFTAISMYAMLWQAMGLEISDLLDTLIELGLNREV